MGVDISSVLCWPGSNSHMQLRGERERVEREGDVGGWGGGG